MGTVVSSESAGRTIRIQNTKSSKLRKQSARSRLEMYKDMEHGGQGDGHNRSRSGKSNYRLNKKMIRSKIRSSSAHSCSHSTRTQKLSSNKTLVFCSQSPEEEQSLKSILKTPNRKSDGREAQSPLMTNTSTEPKKGLTSPVGQSISINSVSETEIQMETKIISGNRWKL